MNYLDILNAPEIRTIILIFLLFVVPRILLRFGLPMALSAFLLGFVGQHWTAALVGDQIISLLSLLGISSLFLLAGLDVDLDELRNKKKTLIEHILIIWFIFLVFVSGFVIFTEFNWITASLISLGLLTPSTGFIIGALPTFGISDEHQEWVKIKAIGSEIVALMLLVITAQIQKPHLLLLTIIIIIFLLFFLPWLLKKVSIPLAKVAPGSDFSLLILLAIVLSLITKKLGAYYLVGAFSVGIAARRYVRSNRDTATDELLKAIKLFSSFFLPFYFLKAGAGVSIEFITPKAIGIALLLLCITLPIRLLSVAFHRRLRLKEQQKEGLHVAMSLLPTLVFGLVLANILRDGGRISNEFYGALIIVTVLLTLIPSLFFKYGHLNPKLVRFLP